MIRLQRQTIAAAAVIHFLGCGGDGGGRAKGCADGGVQSCVPDGVDSGGSPGGRPGSGGRAGGPGAGGLAAGGMAAGGTTGDGGSGDGGTPGAGGNGTSCGNGSPEPPEECDTGSASSTCDADCTFATCGDGTVNAEAGEECDPSIPSADCDPDCTYAICGDGRVHGAAGEECDTRGETTGCDADCTVPECGDGVTSAAAGEQCDDRNGANSDGCDGACHFEITGTVGDTCADAVPLSLGANTVSWTATTNNYFAWRPACSQGTPAGPDVVLSYTASSTGNLSVSVAKPDGTEWVTVINDGVCGDISAPLACMARTVGTELVAEVPVVTGKTYYFHVADTTFGGNMLQSPFTVTLALSPHGTGENCSAPIPITLGDNVVNWTATEQDAVYQTPPCTDGAQIEAPDIALSYTAAFDGFVEFEIAKPTDSQWVALVLGSQCGGSATLGCLSNLSGSSLRGILGVTASFTAPSDARYRYFLLSDTRVGVGSLTNPLAITLRGNDEAGGTGETCSTSAKRISLGTNRVRWSGTVNDHLTTTPSCAAGHAVSGPDAVFEYDAPTAGTLTVTINKPAAARWVAVVGDYRCGNVSPPLACLSDFSNTTMQASLPVTALGRYFVYVAATSEGTVPLQSPLTITMSQ